MRLKLNGYEDLDDAFTHAIQLSKTLETKSQRRRGAYTSPPTKLSRRDPPPPQPSQIQQRPRTPFIRNLIPGQPRPNAPGQIICYYCKTPGHVMSECKKRIFNNAQKVRFDTRPPVSSNTLTKLPGNEARVPTKVSVQRDTGKTGRETYIHLVDSKATTSKQMDSPMSPKP